MNGRKSPAPPAAGGRAFPSAPPGACGAPLARPVRAPPRSLPLSHPVSDSLWTSGRLEFNIIQMWILLMRLIESGLYLIPPSAARHWARVAAAGSRPVAGARPSPVRASLRAPRAAPPPPPPSPFGRALPLPLPQAGGGGGSVLSAVRFIVGAVCCRLRWPRVARPPPLPPPSAAPPAASGGRVAVGEVL